jgi:hypothetical protein
MSATPSSATGRPVMLNRRVRQTFLCARVVSVSLLPMEPHGRCYGSQSTPRAPGSRDRHTQSSRVSLDVHAGSSRSAWREIRPYAQTCDGVNNRSVLATRRECPSQERNPRRQPAREPGTVGVFATKRATSKRLVGVGRINCGRIHSNQAEVEQPLNPGRD